jgi:malic enzyme
LCLFLLIFAGNNQEQEHSHIPHLHIQEVVAGVVVVVGVAVAARVVAVLVGEDTAMMVGAGIARISCPSQIPKFIHHNVSGLNIILYLSFNSDSCTSLGHFYKHY